VSRCCACSAETEQVVDLGRQFVTDFIEPGHQRQRSPLALVLCTGCHLLQLGDFIARDAVFHDRYGFRSGVNEAVVADLRDIAQYALKLKPDAKRWLDIGSNDGTLLGEVPLHVYRAGIDPLGQFSDMAREKADRIDVAYFSPQYYYAGEFDVVTSAAMFYDLEQPGEFVRAVRQVLAADGVWCVQMNSALGMLENNTIDNVCHEHLTYFTVTTLDRLLGWHGMEVFDVSHHGMKGGVMRAAIARAGKYRVQPSVAVAKHREQMSYADEPVTWARWNLDVHSELRRTRDYLEHAAGRGETTMVYGASTRGGTMLQIIGASQPLVECAVDRQQAKVGKIMASTGLPIISEDEMRAEPPSNLLVAPWFLRAGFIERESGFLDKGGRMIFPLPEFEVVRR